MGENVQRIVALSRTLESARLVELAWSPAARLAAEASRRQHGGRHLQQGSLPPRAAHYLRDLAASATSKATRATGAVYGADDEVGHEEAEVAHEAAASAHRALGNLNHSKAHAASAAAHMESVFASGAPGDWRQHETVARLHSHASHLHAGVGNVELAGHHRALVGMHEGAAEKVAPPWDLWTSRSSG